MKDNIQMLIAKYQYIKLILAALNGAGVNILTETAYLFIPLHATFILLLLK